ncbi:MAG: (2Fe-2S)-binding protein [Candidatus Bathyarchaeia archaeon]
MRIVTKLAKIDESVCEGCGNCELVCTAEAIKVSNRLAHVNESICNGCMNCFFRCPEYAIKMVDRAEKIKLFVDPNSVDQQRLREITDKAHVLPEMKICTCTGTTAGEVAAAIIKGAKSPTDITLATGIRTGCKELCIQPMLRLLEAAGVEIPKAPGWQWYGIVPAVYDVPKKTRQKFAVFRMQDDVDFVNKLLGEKAAMKEE